jgi:hypothetical protein
MNTPNLNFTQAELGWSPDSNQVIAHFPKDLKVSVSSETNILLDANNLNRTEALRDVTARLPVVFSQWEEQLAKKLNNQLINLPLEMQKIATESAANVYFSPDEKKLLYQASADLTIPDEIIPPLPASNSQPQTRELKAGNHYVYDIEEDRNYKLLDSTIEEKAPNRIRLVNLITPKSLFSPESSPSAYRKLQQKDTLTTIENFQNQYTPINIQNLQWFPDSKHLIAVEDNKIIILEYDGTNRSTVYAGTYENNFTFPWPDGSKLLIITNLNLESSIPPNLYAIDLL